MPLSAKAALAKDRNAAHAPAPKMTHAHFAYLAATLVSAAPGTPHPEDAWGAEVRDDVLRQWARDCWALADALARTNPAFDRARFLRACGVEE